MKKITFIQKLITEEKIKLVEPSSIVAESYNEKSKNALKAADILLTQNLPEEAMSHVYYTMYNKAMSLFYLIGIKCENHAATIILLKELFGIDNKDISKAKTERIDKQYYTDFVVRNNDIIELIKIAQAFIDEMDTFVDKISEEEKKNYMNKFRNTYFS